MRHLYTCSSKNMILSAGECGQHTIEIHQDSISSSWLKSTIYIYICILSGAQLYTNPYKPTQIVRWCTLYNLTITTFDTPRSTTKTLGFYCQRRDKPAAPWASPFPASQVASRPSCWHRNCCPKATNRWYILHQSRGETEDETPARVWWSLELWNMT